GAEGRNSFSGETPNSDSFEELAQFLLKDYDDHDQKNGEEPLKDPRRHLQIEVASDDVNTAKNKYTANDEGSPRLARPTEAVVERHRDEDDVNDLRKSDGWKWIYDGAVVHTSRIKYHVLRFEQITLSVIAVACPFADASNLSGRFR